ncbi:MAG: glycerol-3-phosphate dehydrogenase [Spirochaetae bacterium HGW-Spirochaetae-10]|nr:MAG: glycerol-3-phosphate dehydrogenase [Spirochaetae bacterium HGW-Spirochaetae-10]
MDRSPLQMKRLRAEGRYDVLVVGGGITGAAVAYEAASRGYTVALVEKSDFGGATSAATGKLIHGGLRYLKKFDIALVREALRERRILSDIAPNLVYPYPMVLPNPGLLERVGLIAYDLLSFDSGWTRDPSKKIPWHKMIGKKALEKLGLGSLERAIYFYDCIMISPERLTLAFVKSAVACGASVANYTKVERLIFDGRRVVGAEVRDLLASGGSDAEGTGGSVYEIRADVVVNAAGPWTQDLLNRTKETETAMPKQRSEGIYLITRKLSDVMTLYVEKHGHFSFAPWRGHSMIGPTEKSYTGPVEDWKLTRESIVEFLDAINSSARLPEKLTLADVKFAYGGLRPLVESEGDTYSASRRSDLHDHAKDGIEGLITAAGGKYTTSRDFAVKIFKAIQKKIGKKAVASVSAKEALYACDIDRLPQTGAQARGLTVEQVIEEAKRRHSDLAANTVDYLMRHYGTDTETILGLARSNPAFARVLDADGEIMAQIVFAVRHEMACSLADVFLRRTGLGTLGYPGAEVVQAVADVVAAELSWSPQKKALEIEEITRRLKLPE